eukprot:TRINITY_DN47231_c0_g1_i1.p2 TRINITY_DN47231_c0_g1~~TRINITY_DN47231_c0_g1_i1.p2  ORF type:complete len:169 (+),score=13.42 TRINITY_DN47231_c0_g1_i1:290-796(+)
MCLCGGSMGGACVVLLFSSRVSVVHPQISLRNSLPPLIPSFFSFSASFAHTLHPPEADLLVQARRVCIRRRSRPAVCRDRRPALVAPPAFLTAHLMCGGALAGRERLCRQAVSLVTSHAPAPRGRFVPLCDFPHSTPDVPRNLSFASVAALPAPPACMASRPVPTYER